MEGLANRFITNGGIKMKTPDADGSARKEKPSVLKATDVLDLVRKESPNLLGKLPEKRAVKLLNAALVQLGRHIGSVKAGVLKVPGLGTFRVRQVERQRKGQSATVTRTVFRSVRNVKRKAGG
jgi:hypothetical protein